MAGYTPADIDTAITVAASDQNDQRCSFSNYGAKVDVAAPGIDIVGIYPNNQYGSDSGTSFACAHVTGMVALIFASQKPGSTRIYP